MAKLECKQRLTPRQFLYIVVNPLVLSGGHKGELSLFLDDQLILKKIYDFSLNELNPKLSFESREATVTLEVPRPDAHDGDQFEGLFTPKDPDFAVEESIINCDYFIDIDGEKSH